MDTELDDFLTCIGCGTTVSPTVDRIYAVGCDEVLCMTCSLARGGCYDERTDRWTVAPRVDDLLQAVEARDHGTL